MVGQWNDLEDSTVCAETAEIFKSSLLSDNLLCLVCVCVRARECMCVSVRMCVCMSISVYDIDNHALPAFLLSITPALGPANTFKNLK